MPNPTYSAKEYLDMIMVYGECRGNAAKALRLYRERFPQRQAPINGRVIINAVQRINDNRMVVPLITPGRVRASKISKNLEEEYDSSVSDGDSPGGDAEADSDGEGDGGEGGSGGCEGEDACSTCGGAVGTFGRCARGSPAEQFIKAAIFPRELNEKTILCNDCYKRYCNKGKQKGKKNSRKSSHSNEAKQRVALSEKSANVKVSIPSASQPTITLPNYKKACCFSKSCLFPKCSKKNRHLIPQYVKKCLLRDYKLYIPEHSRVCRGHLYSKNWEQLLKIAQSDFTVQEIEDVISILTTNITAFNFDSIEDIPPNLLLYCTGIDHGKLQKMLDKVPSLTKKTKTPILALTAYLTKLRTNDSFDRLSTLFQTTTSVLEKITEIAKNCMLEEFIPEDSSIPPSSCSTIRASGEVTADERVRSYLRDFYYEDGAAAAKTPYRSRLKLLASSTSSLSQNLKRKNSSDSDDDSLASVAKKRTTEKSVRTNKSIVEDCWEAGVEVGSPESADGGGSAQGSEDEDNSDVAPVKEEPDEEGESGDEGESADPQYKHLVYAPVSEELQADPLNTVPPPILEVKSEEDSHTIKVEPGEGELQPPSTASTSQETEDGSCTVYYRKGSTSFVQGKDPKL